MSSKSRILFLAAAAGAALACGNGIASADIIQNGSFEANAPAVGNFYEAFDYAGIGAPTDWTYVQNVSQDAGYEESNAVDGSLGYTPNTLDGSNHWVTMRDNEALYQDLGTTVVNNVTGNFSFSQGAQYNSAPGGVTISLWAGVPGTGTELSSESVPAPLTLTYTIGVPSNSLPAVTDTGSLTTGTGFAGQELYIELQQDGTGTFNNGGTVDNNVLIDDVTLTLTSSPVPEPASLGILGLGGLMLLRRRARAH